MDHKNFIIQLLLFNVMKRFYISLIFCTGIVNLVTLLLVLHYVDPYEYRNIAYVSLLVTFNISFACLLSLFIYLSKKIYFRWKVDYRNVFSSLRQAAFVSLFITWIVIFSIVKAPTVLSFSLLLLIFIFLEIIAQSR